MVCFPVELARCGEVGTGSGGARESESESERDPLGAAGAVEHERVVVRRVVEVAKAGAEGTAGEGRGGEALRRGGLALKNKTLQCKRYSTLGAVSLEPRATIW